MKNLDATLLGIVFAVWGALAVMYATIPMIQAPTSVRVWGLGAVLFLVLAVLAARQGAGKATEAQETPDRGSSRRRNKASRPASGAAN